MKAILIFSIIVIAAFLVAALVAGFVYGILKRGRALKRAEETLYNVRREVNLYNEIDHVLASALHVHLDKYDKEGGK